MIQSLLTPQFASKITKALNQEGIIEIDPYYCEYQGITKAYRVSAQFLKYGLAECELTFSKPQRDQEGRLRYDLEHYLNSDDLVIRLTAKNLLRLRTPDLSAIDTADMSEFKLSCLDYRLRYLRESKFYLVRDDFGRFHSNFTSLNKRAREICSLAGEPICSVDLKACYPMLLSTLIKDQSEWEKYREWLFRDDFYNELMARNLRLNKRKVVKIEFNSWLNGKRYCPNIEPIMAAEFPQLYAYIVSERRISKRTIGVKLMTLEGRIMIRGALTALWNSNEDIPLLSLHDAIYCTERDIDVVKASIITEFTSRVGFEPRLDESIAEAVQT